MSDVKSARMDSLKRYANFIERQAGRIVRPYRADGYMNLIFDYALFLDMRRTMMAQYIRDYYRSLD